MFEHFTEKSIKVIMLAQEEARRFGHNFVGTEQILLGLLGEGTGIAAEALKHFGATLKDARVELEKIVGRGSGFVSVEIPFTPRAKRTLEFSWEEARQLGNNYIGTEHLLLGIIRDPEGVAVRILEALRINVADIKPYVIKLLSGTEGSGSAGGGEKTGSERAGPEGAGGESAGANSASAGQARLWGSPEVCCPNCSERVAKKAIACRHCGYGLSDEHFVECKFCKERIRKEAIKCKYCYSMLNEG